MNEYSFSRIINEILEERLRQEKQWGKQKHSPLEWLPILNEEVREVNKAVCEAYFPGYENSGNYTQYRKELIQVAAVAIQMIECYDGKEEIDKS